MLGEILQRQEQRRCQILFLDLNQKRNLSTALAKPAVIKLYEHSVGGFRSVKSEHI